MTELNLMLELATFVPSKTQHDTMSRNEYTGHELWSNKQGIFFCSQWFPGIPATNIIKLQYSFIIVQFSPLNKTVHCVHFKHLLP